jgi:hypothetical protein
MTRVRDILWRMRLRQSLPDWLLFPVFFVAIYLSHSALLRLPYFWDEAGYYIPAAWDFFRTGSLVPYTTLTNAHPPLPSIYLAMWWKMGGFTPITTRVAMCVVAAMALTAIWRLSLRLISNSTVAAWTVTLTALYPVWFAQSTLAHADLLAAACTLWALVDALPDTTADHSRRPWRAAIWFSLAVLAKETAVVTPLALSAWEIATAIRVPEIRAAKIRRAAWWLLCLLPLMAWYGYHYSKTGFIFGNPEYLRYNATSTFTVERFVQAIRIRAWHLGFHMNMYVPVLCTIGAMFLRPIAVEADGPRNPGSARLRPRISVGAQGRIYWLILANAIAFSVLGGALLTRYLLPVFPLILILCVSTWQRRVLWWHALCLFTAGAFLLGLVHNPAYGFAPEDNLAYRDMIVLHQQAIDEVGKLDEGGVVLSAWPVTSELSDPFLGYLTKPMQVVKVDDFSPPQMEHLAGEPAEYTSAIIFSTKFDAGNHLEALFPGAEHSEEKYFGMHHDMHPQAVADLLHGRVVWMTERNGQWAAVLLFPRGPVIAKRQVPAPSYNR